MNGKLFTAKAYTIGDLLYGISFQFFANNYGSILINSQLWDISVGGNRIQQNGLADLVIHGEQQEILKISGRGLHLIFWINPRGIS